MPLFLFRFGFETPEQYAANRRHGWDDENSQAVFIDAPSEDAAVSWGREIAERFFCDLYASDPKFSWKSMGYTHWLEDDPLEITQAREFGTPVVRLGQFPDFEGRSH